MSVSIRVGEAVRATITWVNTGTSSYTWKLFVYIGKFSDRTNPHPNNFSPAGGWASGNITAGAGQTRTDNVDSPAFSRDYLGTWDVLVLVVDPSTNYAYDYAYMLDAITVTP